MTPEEAIHELKIIKKEIATYEVNTPRCKVMRWSTVTYHTFETAYKALEKQIPKKVVYYPRTNENTSDSWLTLVCPNCHCELGVGPIKHCYNCGQALYWSYTDGERISESEVEE